MKITIFGGSGLLGKELQKLTPMETPSHKEVDIYNEEAVFDFFYKNGNPDVVINCAVFKDNRKIEANPSSAIATNIIGAANLAEYCSYHFIRYVYISTDYVYRGDRGNYKETDEVLPFNKYAWSKLGGEASAVMVTNHLIIRTSFGPNEFPYSVSFKDKYSSKDYVDIIAPMILEAATSPLIGILNLGTERRTIYDFVKKRKEIISIRTDESAYITPLDTSLNIQKWIDYKSETPVCTPHTQCRACGSENLTKYLDLGVMPLANNLETSNYLAVNKERYPLQIMLCNDCSLSQLSVVIDPGKMFSYYTYRSSVNGGYVKHCRKMVRELKPLLNLTEESFHIDIAGNDGALLKEFKEEIGLRVLNIDPATNLTAIAEANGIPSLVEFWNEKTSNIVRKNYGQADLITATNVFAHVDNIVEFLESVYKTLKPTGTLVLEFPYLVDFIEKREYDTTYFEHLSYVSITPLHNLCEKLNLHIVNIQKQDIHGGTVRVFIKKDENYYRNISTLYYLDYERDNGYTDSYVYEQWADDVNNTIKDFSSNILKLKLEGNSIAAFGASAKGNTLLNSCRITSDIVDFIADETPEKIGKYSPGTGIPIVNKAEIAKRQPDHLIILSWNFAEEIMEKLRPIYQGKFIIPVPNFKII
jgi:dTDP-4-dehydrorhamnose reductase/ubiquinone/menaquinone biosynthesis C-methylase UbiE